MSLVYCKTAETNKCTCVTEAQRTYYRPLQRLFCFVLFCWGGNGYNFWGGLNVCGLSDVGRLMNDSQVSQSFQVKNCKLMSFFFFNLLDDMSHTII